MRWKKWKWKFNFNEVDVGQYGARHSNNFHESEETISLWIKWHMVLGFHIISAIIFKSKFKTVDATTECENNQMETILKSKVSKNIDAYLIFSAKIPVFIDGNMLLRRI